MTRLGIRKQVNRHPGLGATRYWGLKLLGSQKLGSAKHPSGLEGKWTREVIREGTIITYLVRQTKGREAYTGIWPISRYIFFDCSGHGHGYGHPPRMHLGYYCLCRLPAVKSRHIAMRNLSGCWIGQSLQDGALTDQSMLGRSLEGGW